MIEWHTDTGEGLFRVAHADGELEDLPYEETLAALVTLPEPRELRYRLVSNRRLGDEQAAAPRLTGPAAAEQTLDDADALGATAEGEVAGAGVGEDEDEARGGAAAPSAHSPSHPSAVSPLGGGVAAWPPPQQPLPGGGAAGGALARNAFRSTVYAGPPLMPAGPYAAAHLPSARAFPYGHPGAGHHLRMQGVHAAPRLPAAPEASCIEATRLTLKWPSRGGSRYQLQLRSLVASEKGGVGVTRWTLACCTWQPPPMVVQEEGAPELQKTRPKTTVLVHSLRPSRRYHFRVRTATAVGPWTAWSTPTAALATPALEHAWPAPHPLAPGIQLSGQYGEAAATEAAAAREETAGQNQSEAAASAAAADDEEEEDGPAEGGAAAARAPSVSVPWEHGVEEGAGPAATRLDAAELLECWSFLRSLQPLLLCTPPLTPSALASALLCASAAEEQPEIEGSEGSPDSSEAARRLIRRMHLPLLRCLASATPPPGAYVSRPPLIIISPR